MERGFSFTGQGGVIYTGRDGTKMQSEGGSTIVQLGTSVHSKGLGRCKQNGMEADVQKTDIAGQM